MPHTADYCNEEESMRLRPYQATPTVQLSHNEGKLSLEAHHKLYSSESVSAAAFYSLPLSREERLLSVRLHCCYQILWILLILIIALIPMYNWLTLEISECFTNRENQIIVSVFIAFFGAFIAIVLLTLNCCTKKTISLYRARFCTFCFVLFSLIAAMNFLIGLYFFATPSCYFFINAVVDAYQAQEDIFRKIFYKYDLKISGILHTICSILAFSIAIGFAIIKNNLKYVRQVDFQ